MEPPETSQDNEPADVENDRRVTFKQQTSSRILDYPEARDVTPYDDDDGHPGTIAVNSNNIISAFPVVAEAVPQQQQQAKRAGEFQEQETEFQQQNHRPRQDPPARAAKNTTHDNIDDTIVREKTTTTSPTAVSTESNKAPSLPRSRCSRRNVGIFLAVLAVVAAAVVAGVLLTRKSPILHIASLDLDGVRPNDNFGSAVALSKTGERLAVASGGSVTVYEKNADGGESWDPMGQAIVVDPNPPRDELNERKNVISLDLNEYGDYLVLGYGGGGEDGVGVARIYRFIQGAWVIQTDLSVGSPGDRFGASVSMNDAGSVVAVGAPGHNSTGCVYSYQVNAGGGWELREGDIVGTMVGENFGGSISLSKTGKRIAVGGRTVVDNSGIAANYEVVQIYEFDRFGDSTWTKLGNGLPNNQRRFSTSWTVELSAEGDRYVASNSYTDQRDFKNTVPDTLVVQALQYDGTSWVSLGENLHEGIVGSKSGYFVSLADDGLSMVMGDPGTSSGESRGNGHAHIYKFVNGEWEQHGPNQNGEADLDLFGYSVAIAGDGKTFVAGAPLRSFAANDAGRVQTFSIKVA